MSLPTIRIATRKSPLALKQAHAVGSLLTQHWPDLQITYLPLQTTGDRFLKDKLQAIGGKGLFVKELEEALLQGQADIAVHSMKDVPAELPDNLEIAAICRRDSPFDALISPRYSHWQALPVASIVGTSSLRRQSQLLALRPDLIIKPLRGNIQTRLDKLHHGEFDAIILAEAGLVRMQLEEHITEIFDETLLLPACGQGAIGIECVENSPLIRQWLEPLNDPVTAHCVQAERRINGLLGGNCHTPIAVYCAHADNKLVLQARLLTADGKYCLSDRQTGTLSEALLLAETCARTLFANGAEQLLQTAL